MWRCNVEDTITNTIPIGSFRRRIPFLKKYDWKIYNLWENLIIIDVEKGFSIGIDIIDPHDGFTSLMSEQQL